MLETQPSLFPEQPLPGLSLVKECLSPSEERALIRAIDEAELSPFRFQGWLGKRLTASFGWQYDFDRHRVADATPIPDWLLPLRETAGRVAKIEPSALVQALLTRYDPGAGIGWHRDRPVAEDVMGVSLGAPATMRFRRRKSGSFDRASLFLSPRSIYHIAGEARHEWEHSIAPLDSTRWSVTFRNLARS